MVDIGAYDGCSSISFRDCCKKASVNYSILAVEPDPSNYQKLVNHLKDDKNIRLENIGLYSDNSELSFKSSCAAELPSSSCISEDGDIKIQVRTLDSMNIRKKVTIIKADPPGLSVAIEILKGSMETIRRDRPILIFPAYHSFEAIYNMPLEIERLGLGYKIYLRHLSWSVAETTVFAIPEKEID